MTKKIDLNKTVYELVEEYPEIIEIMENLGFNDISKKSMLNSVGRIMTIPKGAKMHNIPMSNIKEELNKNGFEVEGEKSSIDFNQVEKKDSKINTESKTRKDLLKSYLKRLGEGEELESVRKDFVENFSDVEASEIMEAEEELIREGTPIEEIQHLCDLHSALFHGKTKQERIINAEKEVMESLNRKKAKEEASRIDKHAITDSLAKIPGHPLNTFTRENEKLKILIDRYKVEKTYELFKQICEVSIHYAKKGDLLYPHLKTEYEISGPSDVMWTVDDEIRDELKVLLKDNSESEEWYSRLDDVLVRIEEMIYKEENILFPVCAVNFTNEYWYYIYHDLKDYDLCFEVENIIWEEGENNKREDMGFVVDEIVLPGGHMNLSQLRAMLNTIPLEITFIDSDNINRFFNEGSKIFKRPKIAIGHDVFSCHPPKVEPMVRGIINDFRNNVRDSVPVWMEKDGRTMLVTYMAVRDHNNVYMGTLEIVQDMEFAKEYFNN